MNKRIKKKHWKKAFAWVSAKFFGAGFYLSEEDYSNLSEIIKKDRYREATLYIQDKYLNSILSITKTIHEKIISEDIEFKY